jgi:hypothetical protein
MNIVHLETREIRARSGVNLKGSRSDRVRAIISRNWSTECFRTSASEEQRCEIAHSTGFDDLANILGDRGAGQETQRSDHMQGCLRSDASFGV